MKMNENISDELLSVAPTLSRLENGVNYTIPKNYFDRFSETVLSRIKKGIEPTYYFPKEMPFTLPANYFNDLPGIVLQKIKTAATEINTFDELEAISPLLNTISKKNLYATPNGYFENLEPSNIQAPVIKPGRIVKPRVFTMYRFAVAAVVTAILCVGIFLMLDKNINPSQVNSNKTEIKNLSEDDISEFLSANANSEESGTPIISAVAVTPDIHDAVKEISDDEIKQFLQDSEVPEGI
jgi:hypothetical protein